jgi:hypothetical protein
MKEVWDRAQRLAAEQPLLGVVYSPLAVAPILSIVPMPLLVLRLAFRWRATPR